MPSFVNSPRPALRKQMKNEIYKSKWNSIAFYLLASVMDQPKDRWGKLIGAMDFFHHGVTSKAFMQKSLIVWAANWDISKSALTTCARIRVSLLLISTSLEADTENNAENTISRFKVFMIKWNRYTTKYIKSWSALVNWKLIPFTYHTTRQK